MLKSKLIILLSVFLLIGFTSSAYSATTLKKLGDHPFYTPPLTSVADLQTLVQKRSAKIEEGFKKAGAADLYPAFMEQFPNAKVESVVIAPGDTMQWMLFRKWGKGAIGVAKDITWGGKASFEAFRFVIQKDGKMYEFVVPYACGNIALKSVTAPVAAAPVNQPPVCDLKLSSSEVKCGKVVTADASGSYDPDGTIASVSFKLVDGANNTVVEKVDTEAPYVQEITVPCQSDHYSVQVVVTDDKGAQSSNAGCSQNIVAVKPVGGPVVALGYMYQFDPGNYVLARVGYDYAINEKLHALGLVGGAFQFHGYDGESALTLDGIMNYYIMPNVALGAGAGFWSGDDGRADLILNGSYMLPKDLLGLKTSVFVEGRCDFDELDDIGLSGRLGMGLMLHF
jgi:hypothetical protein